MLRRLSLATATAAIAIPVVKAGSNQTSSLSTTMMKPKDLPIYTEPTSKVEYQAVPHEKGQLESSISVVRKQIWKWSDKCQVGCMFVCLFCLCLFALCLRLRSC